MRNITCLSVIAFISSLLHGATTDAPYFYKKDTWLETVIASRQALREYLEKQNAKLHTSKNANPLLKTFESVRLDISGASGLRDVKVPVAGLREVYVGVKGDPYVHVLNARVVYADGTTRPVELGAPGTPIRQTSGHWSCSRLRDIPANVKIGDREFAQWLEGQNAEITVALDGKAQTLEMSVGQRNAKEARVAQFYVEWYSLLQNEEKNTKYDAELWHLVAAAFPGQQSLRYQELEESAGIWRRDWVDVRELADRYARGCEPALRAQASARAKDCKTLADLQSVRDLFYAGHVKPRLELARKTLDYVQRSAPRPELATQLADLEKQFQNAQNGQSAGLALYDRACELRRKIILSHPLLAFDKLLINKRSSHLPEHMCDQYLGRHSQAAPGLTVLENWRESPKQTVLLDGKLPKGALLHPDLSFDGKHVLFAFADHSTARTGVLRGYYIYEYDFEKGQARQITGTERDPMEGRLGRQTTLIEDMDPCYLPDGGMAFISTRSQQFGRCHGGRYVPSYVLYRAELDGSNIRALSLNESNEWGPSVLPDGTLVYCRWDYVNRHDVKFQSLWTMRPDGTQTLHYYGNNSPAPCLISEAQSISGSMKTVCTAAAHHGQTFGTIVVVDPDKGQEDGAPLTWITPELRFPESGIPPGITATAMPLPEDTYGGRAATPWPLSDTLFLCTYGLGRERAENNGIFLIDTLGGRELIFADPQISCCDPIPLRPRVKPPAVNSEIAGRLKEKTGEFWIQNVYESTQPIPPGSIKQLRINEIISQPTSHVPPRSYANNELVKKVLGTVPVNPDGSVAFEAPAATPLQFQLLDKDGLAVMTMRSLVYVQPGERAACIGCHENRFAAPRQKVTLDIPVRQIKPPAGPCYEGGFSFVRSVQPVFDRYCISCHGLDKTEKIDLTGSLQAFRKDNPGKTPDIRLRVFNDAYASLIDAPGMVKVAPRNGETIFSKPMDYFGNAGKLARMLLDGHPAKDGTKRVKLDPDSFERVANWLDLNAQFYGDYSFNRIETQPPLPAGEKALRAAIAARFGNSIAAQPFATLVNVANPAESRILMAPLPAAAGGWGQITQGAYGGTNDTAYKEMRKLVEASITPLQYHDVAGTCGRGDKCVCGNCWARIDMQSRQQHAEAATK